MNDHEAAQVIEQVHAIENMSAQLRLGEAPGRVEVEGVLERGFGRLMGLEAELQRARGRSPSGENAENAENAANGANGANGEAVQELMGSITVLRAALTELRTLSSPPGPPRIGYCFVLPP
jgi:hypothetical protein